MPATNGKTNGTATKFVIPSEMKAVRYNKIKDFSLVTMPVPEPKAHEILIKGKNPTSSRLEATANCNKLNRAASVAPTSIYTMVTSTLRCP